MKYLYKKRLLNLGRKMGIEDNPPAILNELRRREPSFSNLTPASIILKYYEDPNNFNNSNTIILIISISKIIFFLCII